MYNEVNGGSLQLSGCKQEYAERNVRRTPVDRQLHISSRTAQSLSILLRSANIYPDAQPRPPPVQRGRRPWLDYEPTTLRLPRVVFPSNTDSSRAPRGRETILSDIFAGNPWADMHDEELDDATVDLTTDGADLGARLDSNLYDAFVPPSNIRRSAFSATTSETGAARRASPELVDGPEEPGEDQENDHESLEGLSEAALARLFDFEPALDVDGLGRFRVERGTRDPSGEMDRWNLDSSMDLSNTSVGGSGEGTSAASVSASAASSSSTVRTLFPRRPPSVGSQPFRQSSVRRNRFRAGDNASMRRRLANRDLSLATGSAGSAWARWEVDSDEGQPSSSLYSTRMNRRPNLGNRPGLGVGNNFQEMRVYRRLMREGERDLRRNWDAADSNAEQPSASGGGAGPSNVPSGSGSSSITTVTPTAVGPAGLYFHPDNPPIETTGLVLSPPPALRTEPLSSSTGPRRRPFPPRGLERGSYYRGAGSSLFGMDGPHSPPTDEVDELVAIDLDHSQAIPRGPTPGLSIESLTAASGTLSALGGDGVAVPGDQLVHTYSRVDSHSRVRDGPGSAGATPRARPFNELLPEDVVPIGLESWRQSSPQSSSVVAQARQLLHSPNREDDADAASVAALLQ